MSDDLAVVRDLLRATPGETLVQQVQGLLVALHAEQHRCGDLEAVLASERETRQAHRQRAGSGMSCTWSGESRCAM